MKAYGRTVSECIGELSVIEPTEEQRYYGDVPSVVFIFNDRRKQTPLFLCPDNHPDRLRAVDDLPFLFLAYRLEPVLRKWLERLFLWGHRLELKL